VFGGWIYLNHIDLFTGKLAPTSHDWQGLTEIYRNSIFILFPIGVILFFYYSYLMWSLSKEIYKIEQPSPVNHRPFGTSGMASADSASRAEAMPEASGDSWLGTFAKKMKPLITGILIGAVLSFFVACLYLYSLWLPITAICIILCGVCAKIFWKTPIFPSMLGVAFALVIYFSWFWIPAEIAVRTAESPEEHAKAGMLMATRGQIFPDKDRAFEQWVMAARGDHVPSLLVIGNAYLYGHYGRPRDPSLARRWLERARGLGSKEASESLQNDYFYPKRISEQEVDGNPL